MEATHSDVRSNFCGSPGRPGIVVIAYQLELESTRMPEVNERLPNRVFKN